MQLNYDTPPALAEWCEIRLGLGEMLVTRNDDVYIKGKSGLVREPP